MIIRDSDGRPLNLSTRGLSEPKSIHPPSRLPIAELRRELKNPTGIVRIDFDDISLGVTFRAPRKTSDNGCPSFQYTTGRIGCRFIPVGEWKKLVAFLKTTKKARAAKAGA
jgi:hypothetical protein